MYCMCKGYLYVLYWSVLVSILCIDLLYSKQFVQIAQIDSICKYLPVLICVLVYLYMLHDNASISTV